MSLPSDMVEDARTYLPELLDGLQLSLTLTGISLLIGLPIGLILALGVTTPRRLLRWISIALIEFGRGAPVLVVLQAVYYGLPTAGLTLSAMVSAAAALTFTAAGYTAEFLRAGLAAVPPGEVEGAVALGMSTLDTRRFIVIPQGVRIALPSLMGFAVMLFQATSLAYSVAVPELMSRAYSIGSSNFRYLSIFAVAGLLYAAISIPCTWLSVLAERRLSRHL